MSKIRSEDTKPEKLLRSLLFKNGFRFRIHQADLPGKPDVVLTKYRSTIFVHGCFWHYHRNCPEGRIPNTNSKFWKEKLFKNIERDKKHKHTLKKAGWNVITVWECEIENYPQRVLKKIIKQLKSDE